MTYNKFPHNSSDNLLFSHQSRASTYLDFIQKRSGVKGQIPRDRDLFLSNDEKMQRIQDIIWQIAATDVPVLITGEPGVGKKVIAHAIHDAKNDKQRALLIVDCAALSPSLFEHEGFAGGNGEFANACAGSLSHYGTIVLDEITDLDAAQQTKLLRMLQEKELEQKSHQKSLGAYARIIATTSRDILSLVTQGKFRQDLYYRLYVLHIDVPPLRQRPKDVMLVATTILNEAKVTSKRPNLAFSEEAIAKLKAYQWPGNMRELQKVVQKAILLSSEDKIAEHCVHLDGASAEPTHNWVDSLPIGKCLRLIETQFILETLKHHKGNRTHAAKSLGISLRTLRNKINEFTAEGFEVMAPISGRSLR